MELEQPVAGVGHLVNSIALHAIDLGDLSLKIEFENVDRTRRGSNALPCGGLDPPPCMLAVGWLVYCITLTGEYNTG